MKKLLIFAYTLDMGGAEKALVDTINFLHDKCEIDLYLLEKKGALLERVPKDVNVFAMKKNPIQYSLFRFWAPYRKKVINKIANAKDYDIVIGYLEGRCGTWVADISKKIKKGAIRPLFHILRLSSPDAIIDRIIKSFNHNIPTSLTVESAG